MIIKSFTVKNFRNISEASFEFSDSVNIFSGRNAQGKTNLMEALSSCLGKSFRDARAADIIPFAAEGAAAKTSLGMRYTNDSYPDKTNVLLSEPRGNGFHITCNGIDMNKAEKLYGALRYVVFTPDDLYLIKGAPELRRDYIDFTADMMNRVHHKQVMAYRRAVKQKNSLLSRIDSPSPEHAAMVETWNENIARAGVNVFCGRVKYFRLLQEYASEIYASLSGNGEKLDIKYVSSVFGDENDYIRETPDAKELFSIYYTRLNSRIREEFMLKRTLTGIHKDDVLFLINGRNARKYASQGQIRSITLSLKMAEARMYALKDGNRPVVILDDILSELDEYRRDFIISNTNGLQLFITGCSKYDFDKFRGNIWYVSHGNFFQE